MAKYPDRLLSRMRALPMIITVIVLALFIAPAMAADVTIPVNKDLTSGDMIIHVTKVTITDKYWGNTYSADPDNTIWPKVWFIYENMGSTSANGNLYVAFADDKGNKYWDSRFNMPISDITMNPIQPGKTSDERFVEAAAPKDTKITKVILYNHGQQEAMVIDIPGRSVASATAATTPSQGDNGCSIAVILPIFSIGMFITARKYSK